MLRKETFVMVEYDIETPRFGLIVDILCFDAVVLLYVQRYVGEIFNSHFNAFRVKSIGEFVVVNLWSIQGHRTVTVI